MGTFDWYEPVPAITCAQCGETLDHWQGKDGACNQWVWRQGEPAPVEHRVDPEWVRDGSAERLPPRFEFHARCSKGHSAHGLGEAPTGVWTQTRMFTPVAPRKGPAGRWTCVCCGCFTLEEEPPGSFQICPVCWWEDDPTQYADPDLPDHANQPSLMHARRLYLESGVSDLAHQARVRAPRPDEE
ncbi:MAG: hypothetical protein K1X94_22310 [Sandaracinaceae bacterium]|nr:hypothetical protein [Sandaracinaceae bacterium]